MAWGTAQIPESTLRILGEVEGRDILEFGCGAAQWSIALAQHGARPVGLDLSERQLEHARRLMAEAGVSFPLIHGSAEAVPLPDASFDIVFCDHGAMTFADPYRTVPEAARLLRPGGLFAFNHHSPIEVAVLGGWRRARSASGSFSTTSGCTGSSTSEIIFQLPYGEWIGLFRANGLTVEDLVEPRPADDATSSYRSASGAGVGAPLAGRVHLAAPPSLSSAEPDRRASDASVGVDDQAVQVARAVELDERLPSSAGTDLAVGDDRMSGQRPSVGRPARQLAFVDRRPDPGHDPCAPLRVPVTVVPAVHRGARQVDAAERDVAQREADMIGRHVHTVTGRREVARDGRMASIAERDERPSSGCDGRPWQIAPIPAILGR